MESEGIEFKCGVHVGVDVEAKDLMDSFDAVLITTGSEKPRDLPIPGRELEGIYYAMQFLPQQNRRVGGRSVDPDFDLNAEGKHVTPGLIDCHSHTGISGGVNETGERVTSEAWGSREGSAMLWWLVIVRSGAP